MAEQEILPPKILFNNKRQAYTVRYNPFPRQQLLHSTAVTQILYGGAAGGGKSVSIRWDCYLFCLSNPGLRAYLFRRYRTELQRNHIDFIKDEVPESLAVYNKQNNVLEFVNGSRLYMCFCDKEDDVRLYQGAEMHLLVVDEATHLSAFQLNYLRTRVRLGSYQPTDREYLPRIIFATNPHGGPGHHFLKSTFVDTTDAETIFHDKNTQIFERKDVHGKVVKEYFPGLSSIYIPAKMSDNYSLDASYEAQFTGMAEELIKALKDGDWSSLVGAAIPDLSERKHKIPDILALQKQRKFNFKHWTTFVSVDWGTAAPFSIGYYAVADQWVEIKDTRDGRTIDIPEGALVRFAEIYGCLTSEENKGLRLPANAVCRKMLNFEKENNINPDYYVADSQMWAMSNGPAPEEHFRQHGVYLRQAKKDRPINYSEILARVLGNPQFKETGEKDYPMLFVTENCHAFWRTVPPLVLDENDPDKGPATVKPKQEDHCFAAGTLIATEEGPKPIQAIKTGEKVLTSDGYLPCISLGKTREETIWYVEFDDGFCCSVTPDHKFYLSDGTLAQVSELKVGSKLWHNTLKAKPIGYADSTIKEKISVFIGLYGSIITGLYQKATTFITEMVTDITTVFQIWSLSGHLITSRNTQMNQIVLSMLDDIWKRRCDQKQLNGMDQRRGKRGIQNKEREMVPYHQDLSLYAKNVEKKDLVNREKRDFAQTNVVKNRLDVKIRNIIPMQLKEPVYCLNVPGPHNFCLANGVLVRNCYDELAYACRSRPFTMTLEDRHEADMESYRESYHQAREEAGYESADPYWTG